MKKSSSKTTDLFMGNKFALTAMVKNEASGRDRQTHRRTGA